MVLWTWLCLSAKRLHQNQKLYVNHSIAAECRLGLSTHILPHYEFVAAFPIHCPCTCVPYHLPLLFHSHSHSYYITITIAFPLPSHSHSHYIPISTTFPLHALPLHSHCITITIDRYHTLSHDLLLLCFEYTASFIVGLLGISTVSKWQ